jgi:hypothetical protein
MRTTTPHDESRVARIALARLAAARRLATGLTSDATAAPADASTSERERTVTSASTASRTDREQTRDVGGRGDDPGASRDGAAHAWLAVLPFVATLLGVAVGAVFGFGVYATAGAGGVTLLPFVVLVPYFLVGLAGTIWLFEDASRLAAADANWQPNPWPYVLGGAVVLEAVVAAPVLLDGVTESVVAALAGGFVVAAVLSSVVAGPVYLLARHRALGKL